MKRALTPQEKRTIRIAGIGLAIYLTAFGGFVFCKALEQRRAAYRAEVAQAQALRDKIQIYRDKADLIGELMERYHMDPTKLSHTNVVAEASAALQKAASEAGVAAGTVRESAARGTGKEIASIQLEGAGNVQGLMALLYHLPTLGYPLILDELQITSGGPMPGAVKFNMTIAVLDFDAWSKAQAQAQEEPPGA
jgi:hypothetical protein